MYLSYSLGLHSVVCFTLTFRQGSNFCTDDKPLFVIIASLILCAQGIWPVLFLPLLILSLWVSIVCSTYFD
jgi:hypothetical protein